MSTNTDVDFIKPEPNESVHAFMYRLKMKLLEVRYNKRQLILKFLNEWVYGLTKSKYYKNLNDFKNVFYRDLPTDNISKEYMKQHFENYNIEFDLDLEYDEDLFTTYNVLYFIKLMLMKVNGNMKKEIIEIKNKENKIVKRKKYTIFLKK